LLTFAYWFVGNDRRHSVCSNKIGEAGASAIAKALETNNKTLTTLS